MVNINSERCAKPVAFAAVGMLILVYHLAGAYWYLTIEHQLQNELKDTWRKPLVINKSKVRTWIYGGEVTVEYSIGTNDYVLTETKETFFSSPHRSIVEIYTFTSGTL